MNNKKKIIYTVLILVIILSLGNLYATERKVVNNDRIFTAGKNTKNIIDNEKIGKKVVAIVNDMKIYDLSIKKLKETYSMSNSIPSDEILLDKIINTKILLQESHKLGISITNDELDDYINDLIAGLEEDPEVNEYFSLYLKGLELTLAEYFELTRESYRTELSIKKLSKYIIEEAFGERINTVDHNTKKNAWDNYVERVKNKAIIKYVN